MPRLPLSLLHRAHRASPHLRTLLPACRDLKSASNELRWIREHVSSSSSSSSSLNDGTISSETLISRLCARRGRGEPLQYVLGSQPFGTLDIKCRPGVLIPRLETEAYVVHLSEQLMRSGRSRLRIVDFCSGTGCIALLLYALLKPQFPGRLTVHGFDVSDKAVALARENLRYNVRRELLAASALVGPDVVFDKADIFADEWRALLAPGGGGGGDVDVLISNPPYISVEGFNRDTARPVRNFEPRLALVPNLRNAAGDACKPADVFYRRLFEIAETLRPGVMLFEVGGLAQAGRVADMASSSTELGHDDKIEIWRDWPDFVPEEDEEREFRTARGLRIPIQGSGNGRSVVVCRT